MKIDTKTAYWILIGAAAFITLGVTLSVNRELDRTNGLLATPPSPLLNSAKEARIELDFNNGDRRMFAGELDADYPLKTAVQSAAEEGNFTYRIKNGRVEELAGVKGAWRVYKNGELVEEPVDQLVIKSGDHYKFSVER